MKKRFALLLAAVIIMLSSTVAFADFGDYAGGSDWGYSDFGGSDWGGSDWGADYDYDFGHSGGSGYYYYSGDSDDDIGLFEIVVTIIIILIVVGAIAGKNSIGKNASSGRKSVNIPVQRSAPLVNDLAGLKARDPAFNESKFLADAANLYVRMQNAWTDKDLNPLRTRLTEELYAKSERQVQSYINNAQTNHVERVSVLSTNIVGCTKDARNDIITVELVTRIVDYVTDDRTGNVIRGDKNRELFMTYRWTFIRALGKLTAEDELVDDKHCPNCGAPIDLNQSAVCEYCGSVVTSGEYDWVVSDIQGISQRS
ncbi:MAG: TIM44-like domain-containing protein [Oscillospiraceae bacterium]|nr:TIM44-like domain-containing protein [Oscillospiraceae bacterium]